MRKTLVIGLLIVVATAVGATIMTGRIFQGQINNLTAEILQDPRFEIIDSTVNEGMFSSSGNFAIAMQLEEGARLIVENPWHASHLPAWVNYTGEVLVTLETDQDEVVNLLDELGMDTLKYTGKAGWKKATTHMAVQALVFSDGYATLDIPSMKLSSDYFYNGRQIGKLLINEMTLIENKLASTELKLNDLVFSWNQQGSYPWVGGEAELKAAQVNFSGPQGEIEIIKPSLQQQLVYNADVFDYSLAFDLGKIKSGEGNLGTGKLAIKTENFNGQAVANLVELLAANPSLEKANEKDLQLVMRAFDQLLSGSPAIVLQELDISLENPFKLEQQTTGKLSFDGRNLPIDYLLQLEEERIDTEDPISRTRLELNFSKLEPSLLMLVGIPLDLLDSDADVQQLVFEEGELKLNGHLLPF